MSMEYLQKGTITMSTEDAIEYVNSKLSVLMQRKNELESQLNNINYEIEQEFETLDTLHDTLQIEHQECSSINNPVHIIAVSRKR